jgi:hypothetical protein
MGFWTQQSKLLKKAQKPKKKGIANHDSGKILYPTGSHCSLECLFLFISEGVCRLEKFLSFQNEG